MTSRSSGWLTSAAEPFDIPDIVSCLKAGLKQPNSLYIFKLNKYSSASSVSERVKGQA